MPDPVIPPAGTSAAGFFSPVEFADPAKPPAILADDIEPATGNLRSILSGMHPVDSAVIVRLRTRRASGAAVSGVGHLLHTISRVDDQAATRARQEAERALADLVARGDVRVDAVVTEESAGLGDSVNLFLAYTNLRTSRPEKVPL